MIKELQKWEIEIEKKKRTYLYMISLKDIKTPIYIGKTIKPKQRLSEHARSIFNEKTMIFEIIGEYDANEFDYEKLYIEWYSLKYKLENKCHIVKNMAKKATETLHYICDGEVDKSPYKWRCKIKSNIEMGEQTWKDITKPLPRELRVSWTSCLIEDKYKLRNKYTVKWNMFGEPHAFVSGYSWYDSPEYAKTQKERDIRLRELNK